MTQRHIFLLNSLKKPSYFLLIQHNIPNSIQQHRLFPAFEAIFQNKTTHKVSADLSGLRTLRRLFIVFLLFFHTFTFRVQKSHLTVGAEANAHQPEIFSQGVLCQTANAILVITNIHGSKRHLEQLTLILMKYLPLWGKHLDIIERVTRDNRRYFCSSK